RASAGTVASWGSARTCATSSARAEQSHQPAIRLPPGSAPAESRPPPVGGRGPRPGGRGSGRRQTSASRRSPARMARLSGVDLPREKRMEIALTYIYGIGKTRSQQTLAATGVSPDLRVRDLSDEDLVRLRDHIEANYRVEGDLRREVAQDIRRKIEIGSYQGIRHRRGLPVHGQRTKTNARTRKGPKKTIAGKKKAGRK